MASRAFVAALLLAVMATPGWAQQKPAAATAGASDPVVARVNGAILHRSDVLMAQRNLAPQYQQAPIEQIYQPLLQHMIGDILLTQAARKAKFTDDPQLKQRLAQIENEFIAQAYGASLARPEITEAKLRDAYNTYVKNAPPREEINARHILVATEAEAKDIIEQLKKGADFATLAKEKTTDPSGKASGGDLGYFTKDDMVPEFAAAAFALKKGEYSQTPVKTQFGWHVIKVEDRREQKPGTYEQVAPQIAGQMSQQIVGKKVEELRSAAKIEVFALNGGPLGPAPGAAPPPASQAPVLTPPEGTAGAPSGVPTLSPATAPDQMKGH